jgi:adenine phosphoribosyltransferase
VCHEMAEKCRWAEIIVALDARGFLFAPGIAKILWISWIAARKPGKLPGEVVSISYVLEYWSNTIEIQKYDEDGKLNIIPEQKVAIVDDLLATWGTAMAAIKLIEKLWWVVHHAAFVVWLDEEFLLGKEERKALQKYPHSAVVSYAD